MLGGQKTELRLAALAQTLAGETAGSDGDLRLADLIARAEWILVGVEDGHDPLFLVRLQPELPGGVSGDGREHDHQQPDRAGHPAEPQRCHQDRQVGESHAHVGLGDDQYYRHRDDQDRDRYLVGPEITVGAVGDPRRAEHYGTEPGELARLDGHRAEGDPRPVAAACDTDEKHDHQRDQPDRVERGGPPFVDVEADLGHQPQDGEPGRAPQDLAEEEVRAHHSRHGVQRRQRHPQERDYGEQHPWVETVFHSEILPAFSG